MRVTSLTPVENCWNRVNKSKVWINHRKSWHRLRIKGMIKWRRFCRILTSLTSIWKLRETRKLSFLLEIYSLQGRFVQELWLEIFRRQKNSILTSKFDILRVNWFPWCLYVFLMIKWSSGKILVTVNKFDVHSRHVIRCFLLHYAVFCLAKVNINTLPAYFYGIWKVSFSIESMFWCL